MSKILITGGSGFIGGHFHHYVPGESIVNLDLETPAFDHDATFFKGDIRNAADVQRAMEGQNIKTILSLAAKHHDFGIGHDEYFDTNEDGTAIICKAATANNIKEIIFFSSVAVYGDIETVSNESVTPSPSSPYGASKLAGEKVLTDWAHQDPTRKVLIIRPALVFGANNMANMRNLIRQIDSGLYFHLGKADNVKSIAYVENIVQATLFLKERMTAGVAIYNYADEPQLNTRQIGDAIADALHKKIRITVPRALGIFMGLPFDALIWMTGKNFPISSARIRKLGTQTYHSAEKIFNEGFRPTFTIIEGLRKMVAWYKSKPLEKSTSAE